MPGIFGGIGAGVDPYDALERAFSSRWQGCEAHRHDAALLGGHAFGDFSAVHPVAEGRFIAVDGEWALYRAAKRWLPDQPQRLFRLGSTGLECNANQVGNLALLDPSEQTLHLALDPTGTFPLYYAEHGGGLLFSSLLRPLALVTSAQRDDLATLEFLRQAYTLMGKTPFQGITRLLPGQSLRYRTGHRLEIRERSRAWTRPEEMEMADAVETGWSSLLDALRAALPPAGSNALMMSAGWDSRTLLAGLAEVGLEGGLTCYAHGDVESRELRIVEQACRSAGVPSHLEPIDDAVLDLDRLQHGFDRVENVVFPHWHRAGVRLRDAGTACVTAGVFGEVLGGHYGPAMLGSDGRRMTSLAATLLGRRDTTDERTRGAAQSVQPRLRLTELEQLWYLDPEFQAAIPHRLERMNAEIDRAVIRLERRGIADPSRLLEAFITEHRGTQYINAQLLSCRAAMDIALPFGAADLFTFATRVPLQLKVHNRLNRRMLAEHAPLLLRHPLAATLLPAGAPIPAQELSRLVRKVYEQARSGLHRATNGRVHRPRLSWVDFEFLRTGQALRAIVEDLRGDIWDRRALRRRILRIQDGAWPGGLHPIFDQLSKIYTIDLLLR